MANTKAPHLCGAFVCFKGMWGDLGKQLFIPMIHILGLLTREQGLRLGQDLIGEDRFDIRHGHHLRCDQ